MKTNILYRVGAILGGILLFLVLLALAGSIYQQQASRQDLKQHPPPGEMVEVGKHKLHLYCTGSGSPTVILESGSINSFMSWTKVQPKVANYTRVCSYDRAGLGWSSPIEMPQNSSDITGTLRRLLQKAEVEPPYLLVGHSRGGLYVRTFQEVYPETIAGLILLDSAYEPGFKETPDFIKEALDKSFEQAGSLFELGRWLAPVGLVRLLGIPEKQIEILPLPKEDKATYAAIWNQSHVWETVVIQEEAWSAGTIRPDPPDSLGRLPLIVIRRGQPRKDIPGLTPMEAKINEGLHMQAQKNLSELSAIGKLWTARQSGHMIPWEQPEIVIEAINTIWDQTRQINHNPTIKIKDQLY